MLTLLANPIALLRTYRICLTTRHLAHAAMTISARRKCKALADSAMGKTFSEADIAREGLF